MSTKIEIFKYEETTDTFSAGQAVFKEGEAGNLAYVVQSGEVDIVVHGKVVETVGPGGLLGEMSLIDTCDRSASAIARTDCTAVALDEKKFLRHVRLTPFFALQVMRIIAERLRHMDETI